MSFFIPLEIFVKFTKQYDLGSTDKELKELLDKLKKDGLFKYRTFTEIKGFANAMYNTRKDLLYLICQVWELQKMKLN